MQVLVGHATWAMLLRRPSLSVLGATYAFILAEPSVRPRLLWKSVRRELAQVAAILPLLRSDMGAPYCPRLVATDASPFRIGAVVSRPGLNHIAALGRAA